MKSCFHPKPDGTWHLRIGPTIQFATKATHYNAFNHKKLQCLEWKYPGVEFRWKVDLGKKLPLFSICFGWKVALGISLNFVSDFAFSWKVALGESCLEWNLPRVEVSLGGWKFALGEKLPFPGNVVVLSFVLYWVLYFVFFVFWGKLPWVKVALGRIHLFLSNLFCFLFLVHGKLPWVVVCWKVALGERFPFPGIVPGIY